MTTFPTKQRLIKVMQDACVVGVGKWRYERDIVPENPPMHMAEIEAIMKAALEAMLVELPRCEEPHSAAYCYEKLEAMRGENS